MITIPSVYEVTSRSRRHYESLASKREADAAEAVARLAEKIQTDTESVLAAIVAGLRAAVSLPALIDIAARMDGRTIVPHSDAVAAGIRALADAGWTNVSLSTEVLSDGARIQLWLRISDPAEVHDATHDVDVEGLIARTPVRRR